MAGRGGRVRILLAMALGATALLLVLRTADILRGDLRDGTAWRSVDTRALVVGADAAIDCVGEGTWRGCGVLPPGGLLPDYPDVRGSTVDRFPPLLYVPALAIQGAGGSQTLSLRVIGALSLLAFGLILALPWLVGRRVRGLHRHRHLWLLLILASPLLPYAGSTWSEVPAAALVAAAVVLVAADAPFPLVASAALGAGLSKDTAPVFVVALCFAVARHGPRPGRRWLSSAFAAAVVGSLAAVLLTVAVNLFRYDSLANVTYLSPTFQVRRPSAVAGHAAALLVSPNGGLFPFWPAALLLLVLAVITWRRGSAGVRTRLAVTGAALAAFLLSLALWWAPFGWAAWSPRLSLPLLPALAAVVLILAPPRFPPRLPWLAAAAAVLVLALPQVGVIGSSRGIEDFMTAPRPACPPTAAVERDFVRCNLDRAWRQHPGLLLAGLRGLRDPLAGLLAATIGAAGLALVLRWRDEAALPQEVDREPVEAEVGSTPEAR